MTDSTQQTSSQIYGQSTITMNPLSSAIYAGFWKRFFSVCIDSIVLVIVSFLVEAVLNIFKTHDFVIRISISTLVDFIYRTVYNCSTLQGTPGKAILGICIVQENNVNQTITFKQAVIRYLASYISGLFLLIGYLIQPFTARRQALHDMVAETVVIEKKHGDVNYITVFKKSFENILS